jgi:hypothetical protein
MLRVNNTVCATYAKTLWKSLRPEAPSYNLARTGDLAEMGRNMSHPYGLRGKPASDLGGDDFVLETAGGHDQQERADDEKSQAVGP